METRLTKIRIPTQDTPINIYYLGDLHIGSGNHNAKALKQTIDIVRADPNAKWIGMGDYGDHVYYTDRRYSPNSQREDNPLMEFREGIMGQVRRIYAELEPIRDKCLGLITGNHEEKMANMYHVDPTRELAIMMQVPYLGWSALLRLLIFTGKEKNARYSFVVFATHGFGGGRKSGPKINKVEDSVHSYDADIYAMGHVHGLVTSKMEIIGLTGSGNLMKRQRAFIVTSSYMENSVKGTINYSEKSVFPQAPNSSPMSQVTWNHHQRQLNIQVTI